MMWRDGAMHRFAKTVLPERFYPRNIMARQILRRTDRKVHSGPFKGMQYVDESVGSVYWPKVLGVYEKELHGAIEKLIAVGPERVIDIGAAEGYYAVGMALRLPAATIVAYEMTLEGRQQLKSLSELNGVTEKIQIHGRCDCDSLLSALTKKAKTAVICDVEGFEAELLEGPVLTALKDAHLLVELHEFASPGIAKELAERLSATHCCERIWEKPRTRADYPFPSFLARVLPEAYATYQVQEFRPERMSWLFAEPKAVGCE